MDNLSRQVEEIETLCSIYGNDWLTENEAGRVFSITLKETKHNVTLYVTLPPEYPGNSSPIYELLAPTLSGDSKDRIGLELEEVLSCNVGEPVIFQWIEKLRELLQLNEEEQTPSNYPEDELELESLGDIVYDTWLPVAKETLGAERTITVQHGPTITDRKSVFQGHVALVYSTVQVTEALEMLRENNKIAHATHNIYAYRIARDGVQGSFIQDCDDDGETQAGGRLLHLLQVVGVENALVVVSRWYGGVQLGPDRFRHINNAARQALGLAGLIVPKKK